MLESPDGNTDQNTTWLEGMVKILAKAESACFFLNNTIKDIEIFELKRKI